MTRGRKPLPSNVALLRGNPGRRPINTDQPKPPPAPVRPPSTLKGEARKYWKQIAPKLSRAGVLTELDVEAFALYCETRARYEEAKAAIGDGRLLVKTPNGHYMQHPHLSILNKAAKQMHELLAEFGMTPSSRSRVISAKPVDDDPGLSDLF